MTMLQRVIAARAALVLDQPFFGVLSLRLIIAEDPTCKTAWTDGRTLGFSPAFVATLTSDQLTALIAHEVMHCACGHPWRRDGRDQKRFNVACDHAINPVIVDAGFTLPDGALNDPQFAGRHAEWIYDRLPPDPPQGGQGGAHDDAGGQDDAQGTPGGQDGAQASDQGEVRDAPADTDPDAPTESDWQQMTEQASALARGSLSAGAGRSIAELRRPIVDWRSVLRRFLQATTSDDYSWSRPNVRYLASGLFLPSLRSPRCGRLVVAIDTSGSIDTVTLNQFASELNSIASELQPESIQVIYCDSAVNGSCEFGPNEPIALSPIGGGGTAFAPVFDHVAASDDVAPAALVYFTDLDGPMPDAAPDYPVLWACTSRRDAAPFGEVVTIE